MNVSPVVGGALLGALLGSAFTAAIQFFVVPMAQRRTRHRERWEATVAEMSALLDGDIRILLDAYRTAERAARRWMALVGQSQPDDRQNAVRRATEAASEVADAEAGLVAPLKRLDELAKRVKTVHRSAPYWIQLHRRIGYLVDGLQPSALPPARDPVTDTSLEASLIVAEQTRAELAEEIDQLALSMKPPSREITRRSVAGTKRAGRAVRAWASRRLRRSFSRPPRPAAPLPAPEQEDAS